MSDENFIAKPCQHCPFKKSVRPFLHPKRADEIAYSVQNPYNEFHCHKTTESVETDDGSDRIATEKSKLCAGFLTLRATQTDRGLPKNFIPSYEEVYDDPDSMAWAYEEEWNKCRKTN